MIRKHPWILLAALFLLSAAAATTMLLIALRHQPEQLPTPAPHHD